MEPELGAVVGTAWTGPLTVAQAEAAIFGYVLLNDWSARDIQAWEYQPLGPLQSKATATTISPWIVMADALQPHRVATPPRLCPLLPHLAEPGPTLVDIVIEATLAPEGGSETVICRTRSRDLYFSAALKLAHHSACGCPMSVGDLLGSGTISGGGPSRLGQTIIAIHPGDAGLAGRIESLLADMTDQPGVRILGDRRHANRRRTEAEGVVVDAALIDQLRRLGAAL